MGQENESKIIFFDVDGTLLSQDGKIAKSVTDAINQAQKNGHKVCLATGRSKSNLTKELEQIPWDGFVLGSGVYGEYKNHVVMHEQIPGELVQAFAAYAKPLKQMAVMLENNTASYITAEGLAIITAIFREISEQLGMPAEKLLGRYVVTEDLGSVPAVNKMLYFHGGKYAKEMMTKFRDHFDFLPYSAIQSDDFEDGEIMKKDITKAWGIEKVSSYAGYQRERIIAFGDGYNDIEMVEYAGIGVAMGNGIEELKAKADLVTGSQDEDGIPQAMAKLNLI